MTIYFVMGIGGFLGILAHTFVAARKINKRLGMKSISEVFDELWQRDFLTIIGGFLFFTILLYMASDYINLKNLDTVDYSLSLPERIYRFRIANFIKTCSVMAGYFAESVVYGIFGEAEEILKRKIDSLKKIIGDFPNDKNQEL